MITREAGTMIPPIAMAYGSPKSVGIYAVGEEVGLEGLLV
jgi:hypothetical protein